ncbi:molybdenum cofactor guanylyltransferase [Rhodopila sp.]|uniref:molybdenum cofactor guanylyltransferase n=1 Tax=Rhodopila sp. TaxID=2480087 RepID=UPI003D0EEC73
MTDANTAALVLAGGAARRMGGGDKPLLTVGGRSMLEAVIAALEIRPVAISANGDPARFTGFGLPVLGDGAFVGQGPLAGVLAGLDWAASLGKTALLTAPGDTPFLPRGLAAWLAPAPCCVTSAGRRHHLVALWPVDCADALRALLCVAGSRRVAGFAERIGMRYADFAKRTRDPFDNVNTYEDLANARARPGTGDDSNLESIDPAQG